MEKGVEWCEISLVWLGPEMDEANQLNVGIMKVRRRERRSEEERRSERGEEENRTLVGSMIFIHTYSDYKYFNSFIYYLVR